MPWKAIRKVKRNENDGRAQENMAGRDLPDTGVYFVGLLLYQHQVRTRKLPSVLSLRHTHDACGRYSVYRAPAYGAERMSDVHRSAPLFPSGLLHGFCQQRFSLPGAEDGTFRRGRAVRGYGAYLDGGRRLAVAA